MEVQAHAARTQHSNFSESTEEIRPMTAEEKAAQLEKLVPIAVLCVCVYVHTCPCV